MNTVRNEIRAATQVRKQNYTIREAIDWYKTAYRARMDTTLLETEVEHVNSQFVELIRRTSRKDMLPTAALASLVASVATAELAEEIMADV